MVAAAAGKVMDESAGAYEPTGSAQYFDAIVPNVPSCIPGSPTCPRCLHCRGTINTQVTGAPNSSFVGCADSDPLYFPFGPW